MFIFTGRVFGGSSRYKFAELGFDTLIYWICVVIHMPVILFSYVAILVGVLLLIIGYIAHRQKQRYNQYLLGGGGLFVVLGLIGLLWFMMAFS